MKKFLQKFDDLYKGKQYIEIEFYDDNPLTKKFVRYNQSGDVCHCIEGQTTGSQKTKNGWQPIECNTEECEHRQKNEAGKCACNRIAWLKFFIPDVCQDRIWLMRITGQTSINRIDAYINLQKVLGNTLNGRYILFLKQEEQTSKSTGQTFNNYVLDILRKEDFILTNEIPQTTEKPKELSTAKAQNVNNNVVNQEQTENKSQTVTDNTQTDEKKTKEKTTKKETTQKKETKSKSKKADENKTETPAEENEFANHYILDSTFKENITNKKGESKEYLIGKFYDINDTPCDIVIKPENAVELQECAFGTVVEIQVQDVAGRKFAIDLKFVSKLTKKVAA